MPGMNGVAAAQEIRRISPATKIVFLAVHDELATATAALGARLYIEIGRWN
jgi:DNA-binding NarL/FixJ family response regulator